MRKKIRCAFLGLLITSCFFPDTTLNAQNAAAVKKDTKSNVLSIAYFIESANHSLNSLNSLLKKDNYRNKITALNNPAGNELGFNLKTEILFALKPMLEKAKTTDKTKFQQVIEGLLGDNSDNGIPGIKKYLPAASIFSTVFSLVGNLVITEKKITKEDLGNFTIKIQQFFYQYEKLNGINLQFSFQLQKLLLKTEEMKGDVKDFLIECVSMKQPDIQKSVLKTQSTETLLLKYYDPQNLQSWFDTTKAGIQQPLFPSDASTTVKLLASGIKKLQKEFETIYNDNYRELKELIASLKTTIPNLDQKQLDKTNNEIDQLYTDSRQADVINLNLNQVDERMNTLCRLFNAGR